MVERIRTLLEARQLTPTQFADAIGVARPIVSHILSGRNKPSLEVVQRILAAMPDLSMPWLLNGTGPMQSLSPTAQPPASPGAPAPAAIQKPAAPKAPPVLASPPEPKPAAPADTPRVAAPVSGPLGNSVAEQGAKPVTKRAFQRFLPGAVRLMPPSEAPVQASVSEDPFTHTLPGGSLPEIPAIPEPEAPVAPGSGRQVASAPTVGSTTPDAATALFAGAEKPIRRIVIFYRDGSFADYQPE
ncbi:helix-turn-helix domain-containing protein [Hymenobacter rubidus]|uniref:helix-turn-helix domain-containing protein n=1 Tax=Hymenobacter rubidus TaxID=1441626 RepID=UPI00191F9971